MPTSASLRPMRKVTAAQGCCAAPRRLAREPPKHAGGCHLLQSLLQEAPSCENHGAPWSGAEVVQLTYLHLGFNSKTFKTSKER